MTAFGTRAGLGSAIFLATLLAAGSLAAAPPPAGLSAGSRAKVLQIFRIPKVGTIAGSSVQDGVIKRDSEVKVMRDGEQVDPHGLAVHNRIVLFLRHDPDGWAQTQAAAPGRSPCP